LPCTPGEEIMNYDYYEHGKDGVLGLRVLLLQLKFWTYPVEDVSAVSMVDIAPPTTMKELVSFRAPSFPFRFVSFRILCFRFASGSFVTAADHTHEQADGTFMKERARMRSNTGISACVHSCAREPDNAHAHAVA
jgi:hypothetical protein